MSKLTLNNIIRALFLDLFVIFVRTNFENWKQPIVYHSQADRGHLYVTIDVEPVVFARQHHAAVIHEGNVEALGVFHLKKK